MSEETKTPPPEKKKLSLGLRIGMALIGVVLLAQGVLQMRQGMKEFDDASKQKVEASATNSSAAGAPVKNENAKVAITFPPDWTVGQSTNEIIHKANFADGSVDFRMVQEELRKAGNAREYLDAMNALLKENDRITDPEIVSADKFPVAGLEGIRQVQTSKVTGDPKQTVVKQAILVVVKDNVAYTAVASCKADAFEKMEPVFNKVFQSIKFE